MSIFLCGNTGFVNRGCEAIVRSTVSLLNQKHGNYYLASFAPDQDRKTAEELGINLIAYETYPNSFAKLMCGGIKKIHTNSLLHQKYVQRGLWNLITKGDICLNIGGDTYCYKRPDSSIALNLYTNKKGISNILWCCSIEKDVIKKDILADLHRYTYIFAREQITYNNLIEAGISEKKIIRCCDPAFFLHEKPVALPENFINGNTVGINISEMVVKPDDNTVYSAIVNLIKHILQTTDMNICLIPHVFSIDKNLCDYPVLKRIFDDFKDSRVSIIDKELNCEELKYVISKCRFMIAARTHASIAAYSSYIPTIVLGYSIKSKGIAMDLFGKTDNYVIPYTDIQNDKQLIDCFCYIMENENEIKKRLMEYIPQYKDTLINAIQKYIPQNIDNMLCDRKICTGCGACASICPVQCIFMEKDEYGFRYPSIKTSSCIKCYKCNNTCPVLNRETAKNITLDIYAVQNKDDKIRENSSSGGVFYELARSIIKKEGIVIGAAFDKEYNVHHIICESEQDISHLQGSKYVESDINNTFSIIKEKLKDDKPVLFSGTPCQVAGLKAFLGKEYEDLYTQDFICHGVPAPLLWEKNIDYYKKLSKSQITSVSFRDKTEGWKNFSIKICFKNGAIYRECVGKDPYMQMYVNDYPIRDSCVLCPYRSLHRQSDITLADFWNVGKIMPQIMDDKGTSLVLVHGIKGKTFINNISKNVNMYSLKASDVSKNTALLQNIPENILRKSFMKDMKKKTFKQLIFRYHKSRTMITYKILCSTIKKIIS